MNAYILADEYHEDYNFIDKVIIAETTTFEQIKEIIAKVKQEYYEDDSIMYYEEIIARLPKDCKVIEPKIAWY